MLARRGLKSSSPRGCGVSRSMRLPTAAPSAPVAAAVTPPPPPPPPSAGCLIGCDTRTVVVMSQHARHNRYIYQITRHYFSFSYFSNYQLLSTIIFQHVQSKIKITYPYAIIFSQNFQFNSYYFWFYNYFSRRPVEN